MIERWKESPYKGYVVSNYGMVEGPGRGGKRRMLKLQQNNKGYLSVAVYCDGKQLGRFVHRLVAETFIGPVPSGKQINHKDQNKKNNRVDNLEYVTASENVKHYKKLNKRTLCKRGHKNVPENRNSILVLKIKPDFGDGSPI